MDRKTDARELSAYVDGELDLARQIEIEALLRKDAALRNHARALGDLRSAVRGAAVAFAAPDSLRARLGVASAAQHAPTSAAPTGLSRAKAVALRWFAWRPYASALATVTLAAVALQVALPPRDPNEGLENEVIASHVRATMGQRLVDIDGSDHQAIQPWLSSKLDYAPPVPAVRSAAVGFLGGRVDYLDGRPVAALVYRQGGHVVDSFVWPTAGHEGITLVSRRGYNIARWSGRGMMHCIVSDLDRDALARLAHELDSAETS